MIRHPSTKRLRRWLGRESRRVTAHVERCERCQGRLEEMTRLDPELTSALEAATRPQTGFSDRIAASIARRRLSNETWSVLGDLLGLGWRTIDTMIQPSEETPPHPTPEEDPFDD